eukprot:4240828-Amphidinium_carterae.1
MSPDNHLGGLGRGATVTSLANNFTFRSFIGCVSLKRCSVPFCCFKVFLATSDKANANTVGCSCEL